MSDNVINARSKKVKGRVLFTGSGTRVIDDLMRRIGGDFTLDSCAPSEQYFLRSLKRFHPQAIIVCLADETRETLRMFYGLEEDKDYENLLLIAIGNKNDCSYFSKTVVHKNVQLFVRPLDAERFMDTLNQYLNNEIEEARKAEEEILNTNNGMDISLDTEVGVHEQALVDQISLMSRIHGRKTILVVDDDVRMLNVIKLYLQDLYDVVVVPSGKLAMKYLSKKQADLVLLDYIMPEEDGPAVLEHIRVNSPQPEIPVVFLTGVADKDMVMKGLEFRPNSYLLKPVSRERLLEKVTEILLGI